jgi:hypothetical protein
MEGWEDIRSNRISSTLRQLDELFKDSENVELWNDMIWELTLIQRKDGS